MNLHSGQIEAVGKVEALYEGSTSLPVLLLDLSGAGKTEVGKELIARTKAIFVVDFGDLSRDRYGNLNFPDRDHNDSRLRLGAFTPAEEWAFRRESRMSRVEPVTVRGMNAEEAEAFWAATVPAGSLKDLGPKLAWGLGLPGVVSHLASVYGRDDFDTSANLSHIPAAGLLRAVVQGSCGYSPNPLPDYLQFELPWELGRFFSDRRRLLYAPFEAYMAEVTERFLAEPLVGGGGFDERKFKTDFWKELYSSASNYIVFRLERVLSRDEELVLIELFSERSPFWSLFGTCFRKVRFWPNGSGRGFGVECSFLPDNESQEASNLPVAVCSDHYGLNAVPKAFAAAYVLDRLNVPYSVVGAGRSRRFNAG